MKATETSSVYQIVKGNKFREYESKYVLNMGSGLEIRLREKVSGSVIVLNADDVANACIDYAEKMILSGNVISEC